MDKARRENELDSELRCCELQPHTFGYCVCRITQTRQALKGHEICAIYRSKQAGNCCIRRKRSRGKALLCRSENKHVSDFTIIGHEGSASTDMGFSIPIEGPGRDLNTY